MKKSKITFIITALGIGGAEMMLLRLLRALDKNKYEISLITLRSGGVLEKEFEDVGIPIFSAEMNSLVGIIRGVSNVKRLLNKIQPDIVFCWMYHANLVGGLAAKRSGIKKIYWNIRNSGLNQIWKTPLTAAVIKLGAFFSNLIPELIIVNSKQAKDNHVRMGYEETKMRVIHNGIDPDVFQPDEEARRIIREELNTRSSELLVGIAARFHPQKDHRTFIESANLIRKRIPESKFVLCGKGMEASNKELAGWITEFDLKGKVFLLGERRDMPQIMSAFDLLILSSAYGESFPNVLAEAMSCEVPCVATDVGGSAFIVETTGSIVPPKEPAALADAAVELLSNTKLRKKLGKEARMRIKQEFSIEKISKDYEKLFLI